MKIVVVLFAFIFFVALVFSSCSLAHPLNSVSPTPKVKLMAQPFVSHLPTASFSTLTTPHLQESDDIETLDKELRAYSFEKDSPIN